MARIRTIKPEFFTSEQVAECSPNARLLFIGMWVFCDDQGVHPASNARLKMEVFPGDDFTRDDVGAMVSELIAAQLLTEYESDGEKYWLVTGWKHQKIDKPSKKYPLPFADNSPKGRRKVADASGTDVDVDVDVEGKGEKVRSPNGSRLPADWQPSETEQRWARDERPDIDVPVEVERFRDYWIAQPGVKGRKADWPATWRNWVRRADTARGGRRPAEPAALPRLTA